MGTPDRTAADPRGRIRRGRRFTSTPPTLHCRISQPAAVTETHVGATRGLRHGAFVGIGISGQKHQERIASTFRMPESIFWGHGHDPNETNVREFEINLNVPMRRDHYICNTM